MIKANILLLLLLSLLCACSHAKSESRPEFKAMVDYKKLEGKAKVQHIIETYHKAPTVKMKLKKRVYLSMLEQENISHGNLLFSKGKLRLEITKPNRSLIIIDGNNVWLENRLPKDLGGGVQVARLKTKGKAQRAKSPLAFIFNDSSVWDDFKLTSKKNKKGVTVLNFKPKNGGDWNGITKVRVKIHEKSQTISGLSYKDDLENQTDYIFSNVNLNSKSKPGFFEYTPPKGVIVTEY